MNKRLIHKCPQGICRFQFCYRIVFYLYFLLLLVSSAYIFTHLFQLGYRTLLDKLYSQLRGSLSTLYDDIDSLVSIFISVLSISGVLPILPDNNSDDSSIGTAVSLKKYKILRSKKFKPAFIM